MSGDQLMSRELKSLGKLLWWALLCAVGVLAFYATLSAL